MRHVKVDQTYPLIMLWGHFFRVKVVKYVKCGGHVLIQKNKKNNQKEKYLLHVCEKNNILRVRENIYIYIYKIIIIFLLRARVLVMYIPTTLNVLNTYSTKKEPSSVCVDQP